MLELATELAVVKSRQAVELDGHASVRRTPFGVTA
jgi:hypothetical protein